MPENPTIKLENLRQQIKTQPSTTIHLHITPKSQQNRIMVCEPDPKGHFNIKAKIRGIPENGNVNHNLIVFLAKELHLAPSQCQLTGGFKSRHKTVLITNNDL